MDEAIAALAEAQYGVVARGQLVERGVGQDAIDRRLRAHRLRPIHRGVFAVGHRVLSREAQWMAAVLAAGPGAVLSDRSGAALWRIRPDGRAGSVVTAPGRRRHPGIETHRITLPSDERDTHRGIPVTTPARTLFDLAAVLTPHQLERAIDRAEILRLTSPTSLDALVARYPRRKGTPAIRAILANHRIGQTLTRSDLEDRFLALLAAERLPSPQTNRIIALPTRSIEADCLWPEQRLIAELDGYDTHATRHAFEQDRARDRELQAEGWRVVRITWRQLRDEPTTIAQQMHKLLAPQERDTVSQP